MHKNPKPCHCHSRYHAKRIFFCEILMQLSSHIFPCPFFILILFILKKTPSIFTTLSTAMDEDGSWYYVVLCEKNNAGIHQNSILSTWVNTFQVPNNPQIWMHTYSLCELSKYIQFYCVPCKGSSSKVVRIDVST